MCCNNKSKSRIHPGNQQKQFVRWNGFSKPLHYLQIIAWIILVLFALVYFGVVAIAVSDPWKPAPIVSVGLLFLLHTVTHLIATIINPADENAKAQIKSNHEMPTFDRNKHRHVIENEYCNLCETFVKKTSKHCRACNKCVRDFDHHCLWLNNCVGGANYRYFFLTITSAFLGTLAIAAMTLFVFISSFTGFNGLDGGVWWRSASPETFQAIMAIIIVLCLLAAILLGQLVFFHLYLIRRKMTTYDYIQYRKSKESSNKRPDNGTIQAVDAEDDSVTCSAPSAAQVPVADHVENPINSNGIIQQESRYANAATVPDAPENQPSKSASLKTENEVRSQFTNAAFASDEQKNANGNSNILRQSLKSDDTPSVASSLGELTTWDNEKEKTRRTSPSVVIKNGSVSAEYIRHNLSEDTFRNSSPISNGQKRSRRGKRRRSSKKLTMGDDDMPRPLPVLPENANPSVSNGTLRKKTVLPPLRNSADWASSVEDLHSNISPHQKLPSITPNSSVNSFASFASGNTASNWSSELRIAQ